MSPASIPVGSTRFCRWRCPPCVRDIERIEIREFANCAKYPSPGLTFDVMGFGKTPAEIEAGAVPDMSVMTDFFAQAVAALGAQLGLVIDEVTQSREFALAESDFMIEAGLVRAGTIAGPARRWQGMVGQTARIVQDTFWFVGSTWDPDGPDPTTPPGTPNGR